MEPVSSVAAATSKIGIDVSQRNFAQPSGQHASRPGLDPAVSIELSETAARASDAAEQQRYVRDVDSQALVFQVTDPVSGDIIIQIPDEVVIKARAYARQPEAQVGERVEMSV